MTKKETRSGKKKKLNPNKATKPLLTKNDEIYVEKSTNLNHFLSPEKKGLNLMQ